MKEDSEFKILDALKNGSEEAFEIIYSRYVGKLFNFMMGMTKGNEYLAEEMVQTAFIKLWETRDRIDNNKSMLSYLATISKNTLFNYQKRQTIEFVYKEMLLREANNFDISTEHEVEEKWLKQVLNEMIVKLPPGRQRIFIMSKIDGLSTTEISEKLGVAKSTVETQISLALKFIRSEFNKHKDIILTIAILGLFC